MSTWNYRVQRAQGTYYRIVEVYYDSRGAVDGWSERGVSPAGDDLDELRFDLGLMLEAFGRPVIDPDGRDIET